MGYAARQNQSSQHYQHPSNQNYRKGQRMNDERLAEGRALINTPLADEERGPAPRVLVSSVLNKPLVTKMTGVTYLLIDDGSVRNVTKRRRHDISGRQRRNQAKAARRRARGSNR